MKLRVVCVGKPDGGLYAGAVDDYLKRLSKLAPTELLHVKASRLADVAARKRAEGEALLAQAQGRVVALDEHGRSFTTAGLAAHWDALEHKGDGRISVLIGGADGLDAALLASAHERWRLSDFTLAHELALVVWLEQAYRVAGLRAGHPYHRP